MIIQCPSCRFSGRIPSYAVDSPCIATCPRCRFRFEVNALLASGFGETLAESAPESGPGSSSYELKAITEDFVQPQSATDGRDPWSEEPEASLSNGSSDGRGDPAHNGFPVAAAPWEAPLLPLSLSEAARMEPWYSRVLQLWGVLFLLWAALIVARGLFLLFAPGSGPTSRFDAVSSVVSVSLLVPGAAFLFLLVELGRTIRGLRPQPPGTVRTTISGAKTAAQGRFWSHVPAAPSARS